MTTIPDAPAGSPSQARDDGSSAPAPPSARARRARRSSPLLLLIGLVVGVPLLLTDIVGSSASRQDIVLAYGLVAYTGFRLARALVSRKPPPMSAMFWVFVYVFMAVPALAQVTSGTFPLDDAPDFRPADFTIALFTIWVGVLAFEVGNAVFRRHGGSPTTPRARRTTLRLRPLNVIAMGTLGAIVGLVIIARVGIAPFLDSRDAAGSAIVGNDSQNTKLFLHSSDSFGIVQKLLVHVPVFVGLYLILVWRHDRPRGIRRPGWEPAFIGLLIVINAVVNNPISNGRFWFGLVGLTLFSVYVRLDNGPALRKLVVTGLVVLLIAFPYLSYFRHSTRSLEFNSPKDSLSTEDSYSSYQMTILGSAYVRDHGFSFGRQAIGAITFAVPRSIWSGKPDETGTLIGGSGFNRASSLWSEGYIDLGYLGVAAMFLVYGAGVAWIDRLFNSRRDAFVVLLMPILCAGQWFILRGSLMPALGALVPLLIAMRLCFKRVPAPALAPGPSPASAAAPT